MLCIATHLTIVLYIPSFLPHLFLAFPPLTISVVHKLALFLVCFPYSTLNTTSSIFANQGYKFHYQHLQLIYVVLLFVTLIFNDFSILYSGCQTYTVLIAKDINLTFNKHIKCLCLSIMRTYDGKLAWHKQQTVINQSDEQSVNRYRLLWHAK